MLTDFKILLPNRTQKPCITLQNTKGRAGIECVRTLKGYKRVDVYCNNKGQLAIVGNNEGHYKISPFCIWLGKPALEFIKQYVPLDNKTQWYHKRIYGTFQKEDNAIVFDLKRNNAR